MGALIRRAVQACVVALGLIAVVSPAYAQTGQVKGRVVDAKNQPVEKAEVIIEATDGMGRKFKVNTNKNGQYVQIGLPPGQVGSSRVDLQACKLEYSIVSPK